MRTSLLILGGFAIAYNLTNLLHELGHACANWLSGGYVAGITLNPFYWNSTYFQTNPNPLFTTWGGVLFGSIFALALGAAVLFFRSPYLTPSALLPACALAINGIYLSIAAVAAVGDAGSLMAQGVPRAVVVGVGLLLLLASCVVASLIQPLLGISRNASFRQRLLTLHLGVMPYLLAMTLYVLIAAKSQSLLFIAFVVAGAVAVTVIAGAGHLLRGAAGRLFEARPVVVTGFSVITLLACGITLVIGELLYFRGA